jgi:GAF domain-containing protein
VSGLRAAVAAGVLGSGGSHRALLGAIVDVARAIFRANASSILLLDEAAGELVFEAVSGEGEGSLVGMRFPAGAGIAGWVLATQEPLVLEDVGKDPRFARDVAAGTGFVPKALLAAPLLIEERSLGVLEVLDPPADAQLGLRQLELVGLFARQAAIAVDLLGRARRAEEVLAQTGRDSEVVARLAEALEGLEGERREAAVRLLTALADVL